MNISELIALAKVRSGKSQKVMAEEMGYSNPNQVSKIATGVKAPDASEIIYFAEAANMPPIKVLAEIESERHPELAKIWEMILAKGGTSLTKYRDMVFYSQNVFFTDRRNAPRQANAAIWPH